MNTTDNNVHHDHTPYRSYVRCTKRYVGLKVNTTLKIECSGEENIKP